MWESYVFLPLFAVAVVVLGVTSLFSPSARQDPFTSKPVSAAMLKQLSAISLANIGMPPQFHDTMLHAIPQENGKGEASVVNGGTTPALPTLPTLLYIGDEYCPYCATLRWSLALALMRFGDMRGLITMRSGSNESYPDTATFSFSHALYSSRYLHFEPVEVQTRDYRPLQQPTPAQLATLKRLDVSPYSTSPGSIPFLDIGQRFVQIGSPVAPKLLRGLDWAAVVTQLTQGHNPLWAAVMGETDRLTAAICVATQGQPQSVCSAEKPFKPTGMDVK